MRLIAANPPDQPDVREEPLATPSLRGALRVAAVDFYQNSYRIVPANLLWGLVLIGTLMLAVVAGLWLTVLAAPLLAVPLVGLYRLAGHAARGEDIVLSDVVHAMRERLVPALASGMALTGVSFLLTVNVLIGFAGQSPVGWGLATAAFWGLVVIVAVAVALWPILGDPARRSMPLREAARLAALLVLASPGRMLRLSIVVAVLAIVSTVLFAAILSISVGYIALASSRIVLPEADRLESRRAKLAPPATDR